MIQVMAAQVSFGSQPHQRPQACSPQMAPAMVPNVQMGKPSKMARKVKRSSVSSEGRRAAIAEPFNHDFTLVLRSLTRYSAAKTKLQIRMPEEAIMLEPWIFSQ